MTTDYITDSEFRASIKDPSTLNASLVASAITTASRRVEAICGRRFYADTTATARTFIPGDPWCAAFDDVSTTSGLIVRSDDNASGSYATTWTLNTDFILTPENQVVGGLAWPYTGLRTIGSRTMPYFWYGHKPLQVTAKWGWPSVPDAVKMATTLLAVALFKRPDAPWGVAGVDGFGPIRVRQDPQVMELLADFIDPRVKLIVA